jgi:hypothetical protein
MANGGVCARPDIATESAAYGHRHLSRTHVSSLLGRFHRCGHLRGRGAGGTRGHGGHATNTLGTEGGAYRGGAAQGDHGPRCLYLRQRWDEGCHKGVRLWREIRERGFVGGASIVRDWICRLRAADPQSAGSLQAWKTPSSRRATWLVVADPGEIDDLERKSVDALIAGSAEPAHLIALAREFRTKFWLKGRIVQSSMS